MDETAFLNIGRRTIEIEKRAVQRLEKQIDGQFYLACKAILACTGRVVVMGMGKSHHVGNKIAATLASTGTPAFFVHPAEASHGDLGMITEKDVVIAISFSGNVTEIVMILPLLKRLKVPLISMTGDPHSPLGLQADFKLNVGVEEEACPLKLAPTCSTTVALVMGDALAIALLEARGFTREDFAFSHPGGALGRKLLVKIEDIMHKGAAIPKVLVDTPLPKALIEMTQKTLGMTTIVDSAGRLVGIFTDGDLRRSVDQGVDINSALIGDVMTQAPRTIVKEMLAAEALGLMEESGKAQITCLIVESEQRPIGVVHVHDILNAGVY